MLVATETWTDNSKMMIKEGTDMIFRKYKGLHEPEVRADKQKIGVVEKNKTTKSGDFFVNYLFSVGISVLSSLLGLAFCTLILFAFLYIAYAVISGMAAFMKVTSGNATVYGWVKAYMEAILPFI